MSWRILVFSNPCRLNVHNGQIECHNEENPVVRFPLEDVGVLVLETQQTLISGVLLAECSDRGIAIFTCDATHTPNGILTSFLTHSRVTAVAFGQQSWSEPFKNRCWQKIIQQKILNQDAVLRKTTGVRENYLKSIFENVTSADKNNSEATASRYYWGKLFTDFKRSAQDARNGALNYGYAVLQGSIARALSASGFIPCFGLNHRNQLNAFNLADDLIEPFRPFVDFLVYQIFKNRVDDIARAPLTKEERAKLIGVLSEPCLFQNEHLTLMKAIERSVYSLGTATAEKQPGQLLFPSIVAQ
jgi:CRISPR-associated protein Cas1